MKKKTMVIAFLCFCAVIMLSACSNSLSGKYVNESAATEEYLEFSGRDVTLYSGGKTMYGTYTIVKNIIVADFYYSGNLLFRLSSDKKTIYFHTEGVSSNYQSSVGDRGVYYYSEGLEDIVFNKE